MPPRQTQPTVTPLGHTSTVDGEPLEPAAVTGSDHYRPDIEGMRAFAVVLVLLSHAGIPAFRGGYVGVDVFFVISGFLITGLIVRELERSGTVDFRRFYARRIRRLLPAAALVLSTVAALTILVLPVIRWTRIAGDIRWSALYGVNWRFASGAVDYFTAEEAASPVRHFWSLSVEEQFYLVWPLLLLTMALVARRRGGSLRPTLLLGLMAVGIPSLGWSIYLTAVDQGRAYFVTATRMWELALGGGIAILAPLLAKLPRQAASLLGWGGLLAISWSAMTFSSATLFPGYAALVPVVATGAVIVAGIAYGSGVVSRLLATGPMRFVGGISYSLYLWHWPILVVADAQWGPLTPWQGTVVVAFSFLPAWVAYRLVEHRWRYSDSFVHPPTRGLVYGLGLTMVGLVAAVVVAAAVPSVPTRADASTIATETTAVAAATPDRQQEDPGPDVAPAELPVDVVVAEPPDPLDVPPDPLDVAVTIGPIQPGAVLQATSTVLTPDPLEARDDLPSVYRDGCHQNQRDPEAITCTFGDPTADVNVFAVGDSHAAQWVPALQLIAEQQGWLLTTMTKSACQLADVLIAIGETQGLYNSCVEWNQNATEALISAQPDLVVTGSAFWFALLDDDGLMTSEESEMAIADGLESTWSRLIEGGLELAIIRDVPFPNTDIPECVAENRNDLARCAFDRDDAMERNTPHGVATDRLGLDLIDLTDQICLEGICPAVINDLVVWRDHHHLTATYVEALAPALAHYLELIKPAIFSQAVP